MVEFFYLCNIDLLFNRNILYCKSFEISLISRIFFYLIETFCIVNSITIGAFEVLKYKKAKVELLIFDIGYNLRKYIHKKKTRRHKTS